MYSIAIDGPSGAGKSSVAKALAKKLGYLYVDTGAIYRTVGLYAKQNGINSKDEKTLKEHFENINVELKWIDGVQHIFLNGTDVSENIRTQEISMYASDVSALGEVRRFLLEKQRNFAKSNNVIMDGRDIGTVVLPSANVKIFLTASIDDRAKRRFEELKEKGQDVEFETVLEQMIQRDKNDSERELAPCVPAPDAVMLDNSGFTLEQSVNKVLEIVYEKINETV